MFEKIDTYSGLRTPYRTTMNSSGERTHIGSSLCLRQMKLEQISREEVSCASFNCKFVTQMTIMQNTAFELVVECHYLIRFHHHCYNVAQLYSFTFQFRSFFSPLPQTFQYYTCFISLIVSKSKHFAVSRILHDF